MWFFASASNSTIGAMSSAFAGSATGIEFMVGLAIIGILAVYVVETLANRSARHLNDAKPAQ